MTDPRELFRQRAERGTPRGATSTWAAANEQPYVIDAHPPSRPSPALWWMAGAAACALVVAGLALGGSDSSELAVAYVGDGSNDGPAGCLLEVEPGSDRPLTAWVDSAVAVDGISQVEVVEIRRGTMTLVHLGHPNVDVQAGTRGITFHARPASAAGELARQPEIEQLRCWRSPDWAWVPDEPPAGTRPVIAYYQPDAAADIHQRWLDVLTIEGVLAAEPFTQQQSYDEFAELYADRAEMVAAVSPQILPPSVRIVADAQLADEVMAQLEGSPGIYRVVEPPPSHWLEPSQIGVGIDSGNPGGHMSDATTTTEP